MNCKHDMFLQPLSISVVMSRERILFLKHFKVLTSLKFERNFPQSLDHKWRRKCLP